MKRFLYFFFVLLCSAHACLAQGRYKLTGTINDTLTSTPLYLSSVVLLRADTMMETHSRADDNGHFTLYVRKTGKYIIQISHPGYVDYADVVNVSDSVTDLGNIVMLSKEHMLKEFVFVQQVAAIKIKGDTTEYVADSFKAKAGASVEDLLKKLPGIQVDKNGQITAQGQTVQKVLVDGEEFFSDDPKVVTQGLQANVVDKVQVYDKKSDQAEFTGIDDGEKTKTINLQLKENMKKGIFGKADAGGGSDGYFQEQLMLNAFKGKRQLSAFGIASNTDKVGLGWSENEKYGGSDGVNTTVGDDGSVTTYIMNNDEFSGWNGTYSGDGLPRVWTGGAHFADKWNEDKQHASASYRYALQQLNGTGSNSKIYTLSGDSSRVNTEDKKQFQQGERHKLSGLYEWKVDSLTTLKLTVSGSTKESKVNSVYHTETYNVIRDTAGSKTINDRTINSTSAEQAFNADLLLRKKFKKKGRSFSVDFRQNYKDDHGNGTLLSNIVRSGSTDTGKTNQNKVTGSNEVSVFSKATYTEPLSKTAFIEGNYSFSVNNSNSLNSSYDKGLAVSGADVLNDTFSSNYRYDIRTHQGGLSMKFVYKITSFSFGSDVARTDYVQTDKLHGDTSRKYPYLNVFPRANFSYKLSKQSSFKLSYNGSTRQPTITQIQPLKQNTDPLNIMVGNPSLKQEFNNRFNLQFNNYKVLTHNYMYVGVSANVTDNAISTTQKIVDLVNYTGYRNVDGNFSYDWYSGYSFKLKKPDLNIRFSFNGDNNRVVNYVNDARNVSNNNSYTFGTSFSYEKENKWDISWNPQISYNDNTSTISTMATNYWVLNNEADASVQLPKNIELGSSVNAMLRQKTAVFTSNNSITKWNAYVSKKFFKKKELTVKLSVFDILNQNLGYTREAKGNMITQNSYTTIRRYGLLSVIWNFNFTPGAAAATDDDDE